MNAYSSGDLLTWKYEGAMISQKTILGKLRMLKSSSAFEVVCINGRISKSHIKRKTTAEV